MSNFLSSYGSTIELAAINGIFALSTFVALWSGVFSLASASFAAVGGFTAASMINDHQLPVELVLVIGAAVGAFSALIVSFALLRLTSHWIALASIAFVLITRVFVLNLPDLTGGAGGVTMLRASTGWHTAAVVVLMMWFFFRLRRSKVGLAMETVREDPNVAASLGVNVDNVRRIAFVLSGLVGGVAGVLLANVLQFLSPNTYGPDLAFLMLASVVLGGSFHWFGALIGGIIFTALPEVLRHFFDQGKDIANGVLLVVVMIYLPRGLVEPGRLQRRPMARRKRDATQMPTDAEPSGGGIRAGETPA